jgi:NTE family protein
MQIALALGGGGSKGHAHTGVLRVLEREGIRIGALAGTSMGALIGAVYLAGNSPDEIEARMDQTENRQLFRRGPESGSALMGLKGVEELLEDTLGDQTFEDLPVPFAVTAVDLVTGMEVMLRSGRLVDAVLAAIAIPGVFPARQVADFHLVDGGVSNPVPVTLVRRLDPSLPVVAVALSKPPQLEHEIETPSALKAMPLLERFSALRWGRALSVFMRSMAISGALLTEYRLASEMPEVIIRPNVETIGILDEIDVPWVVKLGELAAEAALPEIRRHLHWRRRLIRRVGLGDIMRRLSSRNGL